LELKGILDLRINDEAAGKVKLALAPNDYSELQFKQHPKVVKFPSSGDKVIELKKPAEGYPVGSHGVVRYRLPTKDESFVPLTVTVWPQPRGDGTSDIAVEYELEAKHLTLKNVVISIPIPHDALPVVTGEANWSADRGAFTWTIDTVDADEPSGSLEFGCEGEADDFFPVNVGFAAAGSLVNMDVAAATNTETDEPASFSQEKILTVDKYEIV
jgi:hypothetical protein